MTEEFETLTDTVEDEIIEAVVEFDRLEEAVETTTEEFE